MLSLNVWFRADSPPRQETDTLAFVCECLFPRLLFFFLCVFVFGRMIHEHTSVVSCVCVCEIHFWCYGDDHHCTFTHTRVSAERLREKWSDAQSKMPWLKIHYKEPSSNQQKVHSVTNPVFEQLSKQNELLYSGKLRVLFLCFVFSLSKMDKRTAKRPNRKPSAKNNERSSAVKCSTVG